MAAVIKMTEETPDSRVARLESDVSFIRTDVADIKADLRQMRGEIADLRKETHAELLSVRGEIAGLRKETQTELISVRGEIAGLRGQMSSGFKEVRGELTRHFRWMVGLMITIALSLCATLITMAHQPAPGHTTHDSPVAVSPPHRPAIRRIPGHIPWNPAWPPWSLAHAASARIRGSQPTRASGEGGAGLSAAQPRRRTRLLRSAASIPRPPR